MPGKPFRIVSIVGTRPEAVKMAPVARALKRCPGLDHRLVLTGQHGGLERWFDRDERVSALAYDPSGRTARALRRSLRALLCGRFRSEPADLVLVQGDTASAWAGALAARDCAIPVGHVEAGLRSFDRRQPHPEEAHRIAIDAVSDLLFAPTETAAGHLRRDRRVCGRIEVTGNSGIDALLHARAKPGCRSPAAADGRRLILATCHRRENQGPPALAVYSALKRLVRELPVRIAAPLHPNRHTRRAAEAALAGTEHVELLEPLDYEPMVRLMDESWLILSDSGGLQEEAPALGRPLFVLRNVTERPEALATGNIELVGTDPDRIVAGVAGLLGDEAKYARMSRPAFPFGDGRAAERIAAAIMQWIAERSPSPVLSREKAGEGVTTPPPASAAPEAAPEPRARPPGVR